MEQVAVWQKMAERWLAAACEVTQPALKRCYRERAAAYRRLISDATDRPRDEGVRIRETGGETP
jgi:hypothetical protein